MPGLQHAIASPSGSILISILLGLGLAAVFRRACSGDRCIVIKPPPKDYVAKHYFKIDGDCFKYTPKVTSCSARPPHTSGEPQ